MPNLIGQGPDQTPVNDMLGRMAYQDPAAVVIEPQASAAPARIGDMTFQATSNTLLTIKYMGTDGVIRSASLTLA